MAQVTSLTLKDGTTDVVFKPLSIDRQGVTTFVNSDGVVVKDKKLSQKTTRTEKNVVVSIDLVLPTVQEQTINGISNPLAVRATRANIRLSASKFSTEAERQTHINLTVSALQQALLANTFVKNDDLY